MNNIILIIIFIILAIICAGGAFYFNNTATEMRDQNRVLGYTEEECRRIVIVNLQLQGYKIVEPADVNENTKKISNLQSAGITREIQPVYYEDYK